MRTTGIGGAIGITVALLMAGSGASADPDQAHQLAGAVAKTWIYKRIVKEMGAVGGCSAGESYTFRADHTLTVSECTNGHMVDTPYHWSLTATGVGDTTITIQGLGTYLLLFKATPDGLHLMRLRVDTGSQTTPVVDKEFTLDED